MSLEHESMCVCVSQREKARGATTAKTQNRKKAACVSLHTHAFTVGLDQSPTLPRIHTNYKRTNESERKGECIQIDYIGGGRYV